MEFSKFFISHLRGKIDVCVKKYNYRVNASDKIAGPMLMAAVLCHVVIVPSVYTISTPNDTRIGPQLASQAR